MEDSSAPPENCPDEPLLAGTTKGGMKTLPFIIANESLESLASNGLEPNMTRYLMAEYGMTTAQASNIIFLRSSANSFTPVLGAVLADSFFGRYPMITSGVIFSLLGMILLWLTAAIPQARPLCDKLSDSCESPSALRLLHLYASLAVMAVGAGGIRGCSLAFGGDQLNNKNRDDNAGFFESFVSWYYVGSLMGSLLGMTLIVYIQDKMGWNLGFGIPVILMFLGMASFLLASPFYVKRKPSSTLITGLAQVIVASYRKRNIKLLPNGSDELCYHNSGSTLLEPTEKLRFLNRACIIRNPEEEVNPNPWRLCTVDQVEDFKSIIRIIPILSTGILFSVSFSLNTLTYLQVSSMDRHITADFEIPAGSFSAFFFISLVLWVTLYDRLLVPLATKIRGKPTRMKPRQKIGFGLIFSCASLATLAIVEIQRRAIAAEEGFSDDPHVVVKMSAFWLLPYYVSSAIADASCVIGFNEFFYSELPKSMASVATSLLGLSMSAGNLVASFIITTVDNIARSGGGESWVSSNINKGHYDYYFWLICGLCFLDFLYFIVCSKSYGPGQGAEDISS